jgi:hypothetical protein
VDAAVVLGMWQSRQVTPCAANFVAFQAWTAEL